MRRLLIGAFAFASLGAGAALVLEPHLPGPAPAVPAVVERVRAGALARDHATPADHASAADQAAEQAGTDVASQAADHILARHGFEDMTMTPRDAGWDQKPDLSGHPWQVGWRGTDRCLHVAGYGDGALAAFLNLQAREFGPVPVLSDTENMVVLGETRPTMVVWRGPIPCEDVRRTVFY